jgi:Domain of unknown function (DUF4864)
MTPVTGRDTGAGRQRRRGRSAFVVLAAVAALLAASALPVIAPGRALAQSRPDESSLPATEWTAIRAVVRAQIDALRAGDAAKAFGFAAPTTRAHYRSADAFLRMVERGYPPLLGARYDEFLDGAVLGGTVIQPLRLVQPDNTVLVALYTMQRQRDGQWRIVGCALAPSTVKAA